jgi:hypothetical protein
MLVHFKISWTQDSKSEHLAGHQADIIAWCQFEFGRYHKSSESKKDLTAWRWSRHHWYHRATSELGPRQRTPRLFDSSLSTRSAGLLEHESSTNKFSSITDHELWAESQLLSSPRILNTSTTSPRSLLMLVYKRNPSLLERPRPRDKNALLHSRGVNALFLSPV